MKKSILYLFSLINTCYQTELFISFHNYTRINCEEFNQQSYFLILLSPAGK